LSGAAAVAGAKAEAIGSAAGKVILLGEHAVVYGAPAIVLGIDRGATARASASDASSVLVVGKELSVVASDGSDLSRAFLALLEACEVTAPVRIEVSTDLPAGAGLGCSAALAVAIVRALDAFQDRPARTPTDVGRCAMAWERVFHGNPSGVDAAAAARGGCLFYQRTADESAHAIKLIRLAAPLTLAIGHSGVASSTRAMVELVAKLRERRREMVDRSVLAIDSLVQNAKLALEAGDTVGLGRLMDLNQMLLSGLLLSTEEIENMCRLAREAGALGAKLTGSGGGGCVVALALDDAAPILERWEKAGFRSFSTRVQSEAPTPTQGAP
jgi:mevalonate kinase